MTAAVDVGVAFALVRVADVAAREVAMRDGADVEEAGDEVAAVLEAAGRPAIASRWFVPMHERDLPWPTVYDCPPTPPVPDVPASKEAMAKVVPRG